MRRLHRNRYLTCFYCGRKTSTLYDSRTRRFECPSCDATNYLDEHGDITDPPVATEKEATPRQYALARPRALSPPTSPTGTDTIFCATCLKNQHLLSASLAQYLPDPDDPDYAEREKGLYRFRKNQERLYPQICAKCEPRVRQRLEQAAYTAKTDVLRRMLDRSATERKTVKGRSWLDVFDAAGRWLWVAAFVLQLAWHAVVVHGLLSQYFAWAGADETLFTPRLLKTCDPFVARLPSAERLVRWSTLAGISSVWWNPRFAQICRGFTRHISGVSKWYFFQAVALAVRVALQRWDLTRPDPSLLGMQTAGHGFSAAFALLLFLIAPRVIQINMAPLFGTSTTQQPLQLQEPPSPSPASRLDETKSIADLLDEISRSPVSSTPPSPIDADHSPLLPRRRINPLPMGHTHTLAAQTLTANLQQINSLNLAQQPSYTPAHSPQRQQAPEEMDWSPTPATSFTAPATKDLGTSRHRAFNTQNQRSALDSQTFGAAPTEPPRGPFWYRVPPAPTTPAQRVFNPPNQARLRPSPVEGQHGAVRFTRSAAAAAANAALGERQKQTVAFAEPSFFAAEVLGKRDSGRGRGREGGGVRADPREGLSGMFGEGFRLDGEERRAREGGGGGKEGGGGGGWFGFGKKKA